MHSRVYQEFEDICAAREIRGSVLEIGAAPSDDCLLNMKSLANVHEKIGIDLRGPFEFKDFKVLKGNANSMECFENDRFDAVLCNAVLEHDKYFWRTIDSIRRVTKPGGLIVIGVPGYTRIKAEAFGSVLSRIPVIRRLKSHQYLNMLFCSTVTYHIHNHPGDYYRFSPQTVRDVFLEDLDETEVRTIMLPPRVIGVGRKKH